MAEFEAPIIETEIVSFHRVGDEIDRLSVLVTDANHRLFALTVGTFNDFAARMEESIRTGADIPDGGTEPIFLVTGGQIEPDLVETICAMPPSLLAGYLVEQVEAA